MDGWEGKARVSERVSLDRLRDQAITVRQQAYVPYSHFPVGAALLTPGGQVFTGCNVENASYPLSLCAERAAVATAIASGARQFEAIFIVGANSLAMPCGGCRQVLSEFGDMRVYVSQGTGDDVKQFWLHDLLPASFQLNPSSEEPTRS